MARTTAEAVGEIIEVDSSISLTPFIEVASALVTDMCVPLSYTDTTLELIERWLSAHFYAIRDKQLKKESLDFMDLGLEYSVTVSLYMAQTTYGQQAMLIDYKGGLASLQAQARLADKGVSAVTVGITHLANEE